MLNTFNESTQPLKTMKVFNNPNIIVEGWYCVGRIEELNDGENIIDAEIGQQKVVIFQGQDKKLNCIDAFCPHMGLNLKLGEVKGNNIRCSFHHWQFNGAGELVDFPCKSNRPNVSLKSYTVTEKFRHIWVWPGDQPSYEMPGHHSFPGDFDISHGEPYYRPSHLHVSLINALDLQHVNTVHALELEVTSNIETAPDKSYIHYDFEGTFIKESKKGKRSAFLSGGGYKYSVRYYSGTIGLLKALEGIRLFGKIATPPIYGVFGYRPLADGSTKIYPIFLTKKRNGFFKLFSYLHLFVTKMIYNNLKEEDGEIYENIRFSPTFVSEDNNITKFVSYINDLKASIFSKN